MNEICGMAFPDLTVEQFCLRQLTLADENEIFELRSSDSVNEFLDRPRAKTIDDVRQFIHKIDEGLAKNESILWAISLKDDPKLLGTICLWKISRENATAEIGYELLPINQGKGIMQKVIPKIIEYGFNVINLRSIAAELSPNNVKSVKLLEKYKFEKILSDESDTVVYALYR